MTGSRKTVRILAGSFALSLAIGGPGGARAFAGELRAAPLALVTAPSDSLTEVYEVDGVKIIHRRVLTNDVVAVNLYLLGGARQITDSTAGIEPLLLRASERGTRNYPAMAALEAQVRTGSRMLLSAGPDWTVFGFRGLVEEFDSTWAVFTDRLMHPTLDSAAVDLARERMLTSARAAEDDPDIIARSLAAGLAYSGHPYALAVSGTETSLAGITIEQLRNYLSEQIVSSRMLLVIVGNVERERVEAAVGGTIGQLPPGDYVWEMPPTWASDSASVRVEQRRLPTNYIVGYFAGPQASSDVYPDFRVAVALISGLIHSEIRDEGLSYSAGAYVIERGAAGAAVYVSTTEPEESLKIINEWIEVFRTLGSYLPRGAIEDYEEKWILGYHLENETNAGQADFMARGYLYRGELQTARDFDRMIRSVEPHDIRRIVDQYFKNFQYAFLGNPNEVPEELMKEY
jgi:zinc protease